MPNKFASDKTDGSFHMMNENQKDLLTMTFVKTYFHQR